MNKYLIIPLLILSFVALSGCESGSATPPPSSFIDRSMVDYNFVDISTSSCNVYNNVNITYYTNNTNETPCILPKKEIFSFYTEENNWSIMCCEFDEKCVAVSSNTTEDGICEVLNGNKYTGYVFNDDGFWMAQCCNIDGGSCYVDLSVNVTDNSTVCDEDYHYNTYSVDYNGTHWNAMCCLGGIEE